MQLETWAASNIGLVRKSNQDAVGCFPDRQLFILADGMGGRAEGEVASRLAVDTISSFASPSRGDTVPPNATPADRGLSGSWRSLFRGWRGSDRTSDHEEQQLSAAVRLANQRIFEAGHSQPRAQTQSMGTTVVVLKCVVEQHRAHWAHVGDSRLYRLRDQELRLLTADHTLLGEAYWDQSSVPVDLPHTNRLIRALGIEPDVQVSTGSAELQVDDLFLLCSDGLSGMVKAPEILATLKAGNSLEEVGRTLIELALDAGGRDNVTATLVRVSGG